MSRYLDAMKALANAISSAVNTYSGVSIPSQTIIGWPNFEDLTKIIQQGQYQISIFDDGKVKDTTRFFGQWMYTSLPSVPLSGAISGNTLTFSGSVPASGQLNVHTLFGAPLVDSLYQPTASEALSGVAAGVAAAVVSAGGSATASGNVVTFSGTPVIKCNIGGSATLSREVSRQRRTVQVSVWCPDPIMRDNVADAIETYVGAKGNSQTQFYPMGDGTKIWVDYQTSCDKDDKQADYSMYMRDIFYTVEYGMMQTQTATQIGAIKETYTVQGTTLSPIVEG